MGKSLVIVESPAKAKTINKYLGNDFVVKSSIGHIRDLPTGANGNKKPVDAKERAKKAAETRKLSPEQKAKQKAAKEKKALFERMGINPEKDWQAKYEVLPGKEKVLKELKAFAKDADTIYLATDLDREGEAIAWHLRELLGGDDARYKRVGETCTGFWSLGHLLFLELELFAEELEGFFLHAMDMRTGLGDLNCVPKLNKTGPGLKFPATKNVCTGL